MVIALLQTGEVNLTRGLSYIPCRGDGHDGIWNLFEQITTPMQRQEILDWYMVV